MNIGCSHSICNNCLPNIKNCPLCIKPIISKNVPNIDLGNILKKEPPNISNSLKEKTSDIVIPIATSQLIYTSHSAVGCNCVRCIYVIISILFILTIIGLIDWSYADCCIIKSLENNNHADAGVYIFTAIIIDIVVIFLLSVFIYLCWVFCCCPPGT